MTSPRLWQPPNLELFPIETSFETRRKAFYEFHAHNPHVYELILYRCNELKRAGINKYSIEAIMNRVRWDYDIGVHRDKSGFKFSNNLKSFYAALIADNNEHLKDFFDMKKNPDLDTLRGKNHARNQ